MDRLFEPISLSRHTRLRWSPTRDFSFARDMRWVPVTYRELHRAAHHFPLCIRQTEAAPELIAILADASGHNGYVGDDGAWLCPYVPFHLRLHPFSLAGDATGRRGLAIARSAALGETGDYPLFEAEGTLSAAARAVEKALVEAAASLAELRTACARLLALGMARTTPEHLGDWLALEGCCGIDTDALKAASPHVLTDLYANAAAALELAEIIRFSHLGFRPARSSPRPRPAVTLRPKDSRAPAAARPFQRPAAEFLDYGDTLDFDGDGF